MRGRKKGDRQTGKKTDRESCRQKPNSQTGRQTDKYTDRHEDETQICADSKCSLHQSACVFICVHACVYMHNSACMYVCTFMDLCVPCMNINVRFNMCLHECIFSKHFWIIVKRAYFNSFFS